MIERFKKIFNGLQRAHGCTYVEKKNADGTKLKGKSFVKREAVTDTIWDCDDLVVTVEVLDTPKGQILEKLIGRDIKLGISSRGLGSTSRTNEGYDMVEDDFNLVCYDMVSNPSTSGAYMNLQESREYKTLVNQNRIVLLDEILNDILEL